MGLNSFKIIGVSFTNTIIPARTKQAFRVVILPKDVQNITGLGERAARKLIQKIKSGLGKSKTMYITAQEFSSCTGIPEDLIKDFLR
jgi:hypothetical protein